MQVSDIGWLWYSMAFYQNDRVGVNIVYLHDIDYNQVIKSNTWTIDNRQYFIGTNAITIIGKGPL